MHAAHDINCRYVTLWMKVALEGLGQTTTNQLDPTNGQVDTNSLRTGSTVRRISRNFDGLATSVASKDPNLNTDQLLSAIDAAQQNPGKAEFQAADDALVGLWHPFGCMKKSCSISLVTSSCHRLSTGCHSLLRFPYHD